MHLSLSSDMSPCIYSKLHTVQVEAQGRPTFTLNIMTWADDISGNKSKQYNAHTNIYLANLSIPRRKLQQEYFVRFCSTSPHASALEQLEVLSKETGKSRWHTAYDCLLKREILFRIISRIKVTDNPMGAEISSHLGPQAGLNCRECDVGGTAEHMESNEGYQSIYSVSRCVS